MVAGNEAPKSAANHQRDDERRRNAHVLEILHMDRRNAAQEAQRHVELLAGEGREFGLEGRWRKIDVGQQPHAIALIEPAGDLRNVGCWVAIAEKGFQLWPLAFGIDFSVPGVVESIHHDSVVAREVANDARGLVAENLRTRRSERGFDRLADRL